MINITITVSGAGTTIADEVYLIEKVFKDKGYDVIVNDEHPPTKEGWVFDEDKIKPMEGRVITVIANHLPWGG